jgi:Tol biopolymer transport system component
MNHPPDPTFDQRIADWLEDDPDHAPSAVLQTVLAAYPSIPQRRRWRFLWRLPTVNRLALIAAPLAILAIVVAIVLIPRAGFEPGSSAPPGGSLLPSIDSSPSTSTMSGRSPSAAAVDYSSRPGWILLEHFGANAPDGSGPMEAPDGRSLWLIRADGSELHELAPGSPVDGKTNPVWSRDGTHIAFESVEPKRLVYETDVQGTTPVKVGQSCSGFTEGPNPCLERSPTYSPDGNLLATVLLFVDGQVREEQQGIYIRARYGNNEVCADSDTCFHLGFVLESTQLVTSDGLDIEGLSWSPDGTQIAYYLIDNTSEPPASSRLWIVNSDGTDPHEIPLPEGLKAGDPDWSPDSSLIVFSSEPIHNWNDEGLPDRPDVYTVRPDGSDLQRLTHDQGSGSPTWTSDGMILFYSQREMWLMEADGSNAAPVYPDGPTLWGEDTGWSYYGYWQPIP